MWWESGVWATARPVATARPKHSVVLSKAVAIESSPWRSSHGRFSTAQAMTPSVAEQTPKPEPARKERVRSRKIQRSIDYRCESNAVGPGHRWYSRKEPNYKREIRARMRPCLNTNDTPEAYSKPNTAHLIESMRTLTEVEEWSDDDDAGTLPDAHDASAIDTAPAPPLAPTIGAVARVVVARRPTRAADGTWVVLDVSGTNELALICNPIATDAAAAAFIAPSLAPISEEDDSTDVARGRGERSTGDATEDSASTWPALPSLPRPPREEWILLRAVSDDDVASVTDATSSFADVDGSDAASLFDGCDCHIAMDGSEISAVDSKAASTSPHEADPPTSPKPPHVVPRTPALPVASSETRGAWGDAVATRGIVDFARGAPAVFQRPQRASAKPSLAVAPTTSSSEVAGREVAAATVSNADDDDVWAADLCDAAGLKDASHRATGSQSMSAKAMCKREASKAKRVAVR